MGPRQNGRLLAHVTLLIPAQEDASTKPQRIGGTIKTHGNWMLPILLVDVSLG